MLALFS